MLSELGILKLWYAGHHTSYNSQAPKAVLVEKKSVMWKNFRFLCMTDVKKSEICPHVKNLSCGESSKKFYTTHVKKSQISPHLTCV